MLKEKHVQDPKSVIKMRGQAQPNNVNKRDTKFSLIIQHRHQATLVHGQW